MRRVTEREGLAIKAATRRGLDLAGGPEAFAAITRVRQPALSRYGAQSEADHFMPADIIVECDREAGSPVVVSALASMLGYRLVRAEGAGGGRALCDVAIASVTREAADVVMAIAEARADGRLDAADRTKINAEIEEACAALRRVQTSLGE